MEGSSRLKARKVMEAVEVEKKRGQPPPYPQTVAYWQQQLAGTLSVMELPTSYPRRAAALFRGEVAKGKMPAELLPTLLEFAQNHATDLFSLLLAGFAALLHRYTGQTDLLIGTELDTRPRERAGTLGTFGNLVPLRIHISPHLSFAEEVTKITQTVSNARQHHLMPFGQLLDSLQIKAADALLPVMFAVHRAAASPLPGITSPPIFVHNQSAKQELVWHLTQTDNELEVWVEYRPDLFAVEQVERMVGHYQTLLAAAIAQPTQTIARLPILTDREREVLLVKWNCEKRVYPECAGIHQLIETQAQQTPHAIALLDVHSQLTYRELNEQANQLAHYLREKKGLVAGQIAGICLPRTVETVVALLAILKTGATYLPLDPAYPPERLNFMLTDSRAALLLTHTTLHHKEWGSVEMPILILDEVQAAISHKPTTNPDLEIANNEGAYLIYTSGSTGRPKGVLVSHGNLIERVFSMVDLHQLTAADRQLHFVSLSFDMSVEEIFEPLCVGASVAVHDGTVQTGQVFWALCADWQVTKLNVPASFFHHLCDELNQPIPTCIRLVTSGGEPLIPTKLHLWQRWAQHPITLLNGYGPTETTIIATAYTVQKESADLPSIPIGRPLPNSECYILDKEAELVPAGLPGELCLGGPCVAQGYLHQQERTAEKFIPNPFGTGNLYRTGDLVRYLPDGNLEFLGRIDRQVKVRGYRIETGEIEALLHKHPAITQSVVIVHEDNPGDKRLVAYFSTSVAPPTTTALRQFLAEFLPAYMIPAQFVAMPALPLSPNGKIDYRALPAPITDRPALDSQFTPAQNSTENWLASLWESVLGTTNIGVQDDFFELGGDSIKGAMLINRLQEELGQYVYVVALFDAPTIAQLAAFLWKHYPEAMGQKFGASPSANTSADANRLTDRDVAEFRALIPQRAKLINQSPHRPTNPPAIFVLAPPRSGTTLTRVILGGHPHLFSPPELYLLSFDTLAERQTEFSHRYRFWREGTLHAMMNLRQLDSEQAETFLSQYEQQGMSTAAFYRLLQEWAGGRILVDKTPAYALNVDTLRRAESIFENAKYIHLVRHPHGMVRSFLDAKTGQLFFRPTHHFTERQLAELIWLVSHQNILQFLAEIPADRQYRLQFEDLVAQPEPTTRALCDFLGLTLHPNMLRPQEARKERMTEGIHPLSKMMGDVKFHEHQGFEAQVADRWQKELSEDFLAETTWQLAKQFGYEQPRPALQPSPLIVQTLVKGDFPSLVPIKPTGSRPPFFSVHPVNGTVMDFVRLSRYLHPEQPFYGLQSQGLDGKLPPLQTVEEMADHYLHAVRAVQPTGPYLLGGRCMGGMVVFEMAQRLCKQGEKVALLVLFDARAPFQFSQQLSQQHRQKVTRRKQVSWLRQLWKGLRYRRQWLEHRVEDWYKEWVTSRRLARASAQEQAYHQVAIANLAARAAYLPKPYAGQGVMFVPAFTPEGKKRSHISRMGWYELFQGGLELVELPANHTTLLTEPAVQQLAEKLEAMLKATL